MAGDVLRRWRVSLLHSAARLPLPARLHWNHRRRCLQASQSYPPRWHAMPFSTLRTSPSTLSQRALSTYRLLLRAAAPPRLDPAVTAPPVNELSQLHSRTRYNIQLVYRCRQHERDETRIRQWLNEADTLRSFLTHFHSLPPHIYADFFRRPNPQPPLPRDRTAVNGSTTNPLRGDHPIDVAASTVSGRLRDFHNRAYAVLVPLLVATAAPSSLHSAVEASAHTSDISSTASMSPPPLFPFPAAALDTYSSPWIEWLRSTRPVSFTISALEWLHTTTGSPWWLTLVLAGVLVRVALLPAVIYQQRVVHEISRLQPHFAYIRMLASQSQLSYTRRLYETTRLRWSLYWKYSCHPLKLLIPGVLQLSALICVAISMRPLLYLSPELQTGGFGWVMNLCEFDHYYVLPIASTATQYAFLHYTDWLAAQRNARRQSAELIGPAATAAALTAPPAAETPIRRLLELFNYYRGSLIILLLPVIATLPSGLFIFQLTGLTYQFVQTAVLERVWVRRRLGLVSEPRSIWKKREEATEEEVREFDRLQMAMKQRGITSSAASSGALQELAVKGNGTAATGSKADVIFSSKSHAKRTSPTKAKNAPRLSN